MPFSSLADFLELIEQTDALLRIDQPIDPKESLRTILPPTKSVFLSHLHRRRFPMAGPLMINKVRVCQAIGVVDLEEAAQRVEKMVQQNAFDGSDLTRIVTQSPSQQVVRLASDLDETILPGLRFAEEETANRITAVTLFTKDPDSGRRFGTVVELVIESPTRLLPCWTIEDRLGPIRARYEELGQPMPVAICAGGDPAIRLAAEAPAPCLVDPTVLGAVLRDRPVDLVACRTLDGLAVPADTDLVIEGLCSGAEIEVQAVTHRINPVLPFAVPSEQAVVRQVLLQAMVPWWRAELPGLVDLILPEWGVWTDASVLVGSVEKEYADQADRIADALASHSVWSSERTVILLDRSVTLTDESEVLAALLRHVDFGRKTLLAIENLDSTQ